MVGLDGALPDVTAGNVTLCEVADLVLVLAGVLDLKGGTVFIRSPLLTFLPLMVKGVASRGDEGCGLLLVGFIYPLLSGVYMFMVNRRKLV
jgi:hypothetical protein